MLSLNKYFLALGLGSLVLVSGGAYYFVTRSTSLPIQSLFTVMQSDLKAKINVTGQVNPVETVELGFERGGRIVQVNGDTGDHVTAGQILVELDHADLDTSLASAKASLASAQALVGQASANLAIQKAKLADLEQGTKPEDVQLSETQLNNATLALADAKKLLATAQAKAAADLQNLYTSVPDLLNSAFITADTALNQQIYGLFFHDDPLNVTLTFSTTDSALENRVKAAWPDAQNKLAQLQMLATTPLGDNTQADAALISAKTALNALGQFFDELNQALTVAITSANFSNATLNNLKVSLAVARNGLNASTAALTGRAQAITAQLSLNSTNITNATVAVSSAQNNLASAQSALTLKKSPATVEQIAAQKGAVSQAASALAGTNAQIQAAQAGIASWQVQIDKMILRAPFSGVITRQDAKVGMAASTVPLLTLISDAKFEVKTNISEADLAKIKVGAAADVTLDAYGLETIFPAQVTKIDPASTLINNVASYKITLQFTTDDERIKSGLTANVSILIAESKNAVAVPKRDIFQHGKQAFVIVPDEELKPVERNVTLGITSDNGLVEIIDGLQAGEKIVNY